jgi:hypothetical protein
MAFSQEIKNAATLAGYRFAEVPIEYRPRQGEVKLNALPDGAANLRQLFQHRFRRRTEDTAPVGPSAAVPAASTVVIPGPRQKPHTNSSPRTEQCEKV